MLESSVAPAAYGNIRSSDHRNYGKLLRRRLADAARWETEDSGVVAWLRVPT